MNSHFLFQAFDIYSLNQDQEIKVAELLPFPPKRYPQNTVDASEIRGCYPIYKVLAPSKRWLFGISEPSTGSLDFPITSRAFLHQKKVVFDRLASPDF